MKASDFAYHRAGSVREAVGHLAAYGGEARVLAGGQSLLPMLNMRLWRPAALVDINHVADLGRITAVGDETLVGALVRYEALERSPTVAENLPLLATLVRFIGDRQVRNRGTIGGSLVQADPTGEMPLGCLVLGATVRVEGPNGDREIAMASFYEGSYAAVLEHDEVLTEIAFPRHPEHFAVKALYRRHNDFAVLSVVAAGDRGPDGRWRDVRIGLGGVHETSVLAGEAAAALDGAELTDAEIEAAGAAALSAIDPPSDVRASAEYRAHLVPVYVQRALRELRARAENAASGGPSP